MDPLSIFVYYSRNKRKALPVLGILVLAVFGISISLVLTGSIFGAVRSFVSPFYKFVIVQPNFNRRILQIDPAMRAEIRKNPHLELVLPEQTAYTFGLALGIQQNYPIFGIDETAMPLILARSGARLIDGRLPTARANEIALHESIAKSRGIWVGSEIGREVNPDDSLGGRWTVVGITSGETALNLAALERLTNGRPAVAMLLLPLPNEMATLSADLELIRNEDIVIQTPAYWNRFIERVLGQYDSLVNTISAVIISVLSVGVGLLNLIYFRQRLGEFGILAGIGYSHFFLVRRTALEALWLTTVAWILGLGLAAIAYQLLNVFIFEQQGTPLDFINLHSLVGTLPVPIFVWLFSTATVVWQISRLDPVAVIDRRD